MEKFGIMPISTPEEDLKAILGLRESTRPGYRRLRNAHSRDINGSEDSLGAMLISMQNLLVPLNEVRCRIPLGDLFTGGFVFRLFRLDKKYSGEDKGSSYQLPACQRLAENQKCKQGGSSRFGHAGDPGVSRLYVVKSQHT